jgi:hypothetical protein
MGWITKRNAKTGSGFGGGKGKAGRRAYPLRKITGSDGEYEILECGHRGAFHISVGADLFSTYQPASSRRCRTCYELMNKNTTNT